MSKITAEYLYEIYREINEFAGESYRLTACPMRQPRFPTISQPEHKRWAGKMATAMNQIPGLLQQWVDAICYATIINWKSGKDGGWRPGFEEFTDRPQKGWSWSRIEQHEWKGFIRTKFADPKPPPPPEPDYPADPERAQKLFEEAFKKHTVSPPNRPAAIQPKPAPVKKHHGLTLAQQMDYVRWLRDNQDGDFEQYKREVLAVGAPVVKKGNILINTVTGEEDLPF